MDGGNNTFIVSFFFVFLLLCPTTESHYKVMGPLCASQITLVNHACSFLPFTLNPPPTHPSLVSVPSGPGPISVPSGPSQISVPSGPSQISVPIGPGPISVLSPGSGHSPARSEGHRGQRESRRDRERRGGQRRHRHHHHHHHDENPEEEICCRWLKEVDDECVCELLAQLPAFLSRPVHQYTVIVGETCYESFQCGSRIKINS